MAPGVGGLWGETVSPSQFTSTLNYKCNFIWKYHLCSSNNVKDLKQTNTSWVRVSPKSSDRVLDEREEREAEKALGKDRANAGVIQPSAYKGRRSSPLVHR